MPGDDPGDNEERRGFSSPACGMHEVDPAYAGYLPAAELVERLNELLEAERAGAKVVTQLAAAAATPALRDGLAAVARDEARYCALLSRAVRRLGGEPSHRTGAFREKVLALDGMAARLALLNRGQGWVARRLDELLPRIADDTLHRELGEMRETHRRNIAACEALLEG